MSKDYYVYRYDNSDGDILYIGKATDMKSRYYNHSKSSKWFNDAASCYIIKCGSSLDMGITELYLINKLSPIHNKRDNDGCTTSMVTIDPQWVEWDMPEVTAKMAKYNGEGDKKDELRYYAKQYRGMARKVCRSIDDTKTPSDITKGDLDLMSWAIFFEKHEKIFGVDTAVECFSKSCEYIKSIHSPEAVVYFRRYFNPAVRALKHIDILNDPNEGVFEDMLDYFNETCHLLDSIKLHLLDEDKGWVF